MCSPVFLALHIRYVAMMMDAGCDKMVMAMCMSDDMSVFGTAMHMYNGMHMLMAVVLDHGIPPEQPRRKPQDRYFPDTPGHQKFIITLP